ncbi:Uncharacterised protein [Mycobacteroides abscessus subsp. abscessus]|nr:Uncharacterised protein [Mycobacteroides abscessus subsp. abscessus]
MRSVRELHGGILFGNQAAVNLFGHLDELDLPAQHHCRQTQLDGHRPDLRRYGRRIVELGDHPERTRPSEILEVTSRVTSQSIARGQDEFAALEQVPEIADVADVNPPHRALDARRAQHVGEPIADHRQIDDVADCQSHPQSFTRCKSRSNFTDRV